MILLQYLKEIKSNYDASSAGFLFENYIAGLLHGEKVGGFGNADFIDGNGMTCQIKFYQYKLSNGRESSRIKVRNEELDYYIVGLKKDNESLIWIIDNHGKFKIKDYVVSTRTGRGIETHINLTKLKACPTKPFTLKFDNIDDMIDKIAKGLRKVVTDLYNQISNLHYNIETIITGVDKDNNVIEISDMDDYYSKSEEDMNGIKKNLDSVKGKILTNLKRKKYIK
jgi:hypothetical protein